MVQLPFSSRSLALALGLLLAACTADAGEAETASEDGSSDTSDATDTSSETGETGDEHDPPPEPEHPADELGPFEVGHTQLVAVDPARDDRSLIVEVWYPAGDTRGAPRAGYLLGGLLTLTSEVAWSEVPASAEPDQPLLIFSHGYRGINTQSFQLCEALASHGFIVASPEHTGNSQDFPEHDFDTAASQRVPDVSFLIDLFQAKSADPEDMFAGRVSAERVGVVGHSFGGMTSLGAAAGWAGAPADPRVAAVAPISAVIDGDLQADDRTSPYAGFSDAQLASVPVPVMLIGGTEDVGVPVENNALAFEGLDAAPAVHRVDIIGATHTHFSNVCAIGQLLLDNGIPMEMWPAIGAADLIEPYEATCGPDAFPIAEAIRLQDLYVTAFFRRYLLEDLGYDQYLAHAYAETEPNVDYWERALEDSQAILEDTEAAQR